MLFPLTVKIKEKENEKTDGMPEATLTFAVIGIGHSAGNILRQMFRVTT